LHSLLVVSCCDIKLQVLKKKYIECNIIDNKTYSIDVLDNPAIVNYWEEHNIV
jgi:hypothetical protein